MNSKIIETAKKNIKNGLEFFAQLEKHFETLKQIDGYDNYSVSNKGNVRNDTKGTIMKLTPSSNDYLFLRLCENGIAKIHYIHKLVALHFINNSKNKIYVDHIDNNKSNNNVENLRWATPSQNNFNQKMSKLNTSGVKGVSWCKTKCMWHVGIKHNYKTINLGYFDNIEEAKIARQAKANELFGEYINSCEK